MSEEKIGSLILKNKGYEKENSSIIEALKKAGFYPVLVDDGEYYQCWIIDETAAVHS